MKKTAFALIMMFSMFAFAADSYKPGKIVKWENGTYAENSKKMKNWIVYQLQAGETVQYELKKNNQVQLIDASGKKHEYQIVGQTAAPAQ
jgi:hypothetical protein